MTNPAPRKPNKVTIDSTEGTLDILVDVYELDPISDDMREHLDRRKRERREQREREAREQGGNTPPDQAPPTDTPAA